MDPSGPVYPEGVTTPASEVDSPDVGPDGPDGPGGQGAPGGRAAGGTRPSARWYARRDGEAGAIPAQQRMGPVRRTVREIGLTLITLGVIVLLFVAYQLFGTNIAEAHSQSNLKKSFAAEVAHNRGTPVSHPADNPALGGPTTSTPGTPTSGAIDELVIPKMGIDKYVVQGVGEADLRRGPGHYPNTPLPGQVGNSAIAGHRTTYGAPFFDLDKLGPGDDVFIINTDGTRLDFKVTGTKVVSPDNVSVLDPTTFPQLTLTTCNPRFSATSRLIVFARLAANVAPLATPPTTAPPPAVHNTLVSDNLGRGNRHAWPAVWGYGALVLVLWVLVRLLINRTRRWARAGAYVGGIAVCLIPLWFMFENVVLLLPQNI